jgi:tetratricopeptide (TPR) repeat protein
MWSTSPERGTKLRACIASVFLLAGCGARTPAVVMAPMPPDAAEQANIGCYECLQNALEAYESVPPTSRSSAFRAAMEETALLLAFRQRELGILEPDYLKVARDVDGTLPAPLSRAPYIKLAFAAPWNTRGMATEKAEAQVHGEWDGNDLTALNADTAGSDTLKQYALITVRCTLGFDTASPEAPATPIVKFRASICQPYDQQALESLLSEHPRFVEAHYFLGRGWLAKQKLRSAAREIGLAVEQWPEFLAARLELGNILLASEDFTGADTAFAAVITREPLHRDALLGRARALAGLERYRESTGAADALIAAGTWYLLEAWEQKASNFYALGEFDPATDAAKTGLTYGETWNLKRLLGFSHYGARRFANAQTWLQLVADGVPNDCEARYFLGGAKSELGDNRAALDDVLVAIACFDAAARDAQAGIDQPPAADEDPGQHARRVQRLTKDRDHATKMGSQAGDAAMALQKSLK